jgi:hypothetical protein
MPLPTAPPFTDPSGLDLDRTLARRFIPLADRLRNFLTKFGLRPYVIRIVRIAWSQGIRGQGVPNVVKALDILPTPKMTDLNALTEIVTPGGVDEVGTIVVSQVSGQFTEEDLRGFEKDGSTVPDDQEVYWEIEFLRADGLPGERRRFEMRAAPQYFAGRFQWIVRLEKSIEDRSRDGTPPP